MFRFSTGRIIIGACNLKLLAGATTPNAHEKGVEKNYMAFGVRDKYIVASGTKQGGMGRSGDFEARIHDGKGWDVYLESTIYASSTDLARAKHANLPSDGERSRCCIDGSLFLRGVESHQLPDRHVTLFQLRAKDKLPTALHIFRCAQGEAVREQKEG